jgi:hypothetical protein
MGPEEGFDATAQLGIVAAFSLQYGPPRGRRQLGDRLKDALKINGHITIPVHTALTCVNGAASCRKNLGESL